MIIEWTAQSLRDIAYWGAVNPTMITKINALITSIESTPFTGLGKPEPLKRNWSGHWSRRISGEHRLVYRVEGRKLIIVQARYHYVK